MSSHDESRDELDEAQQEESLAPLISGAVSSLDEPTEPPELSPATDRLPGAVRISGGTPPLPEGLELVREFVPNEPVDPDVEQLGFDFIEAFLDLTESLVQHERTRDVSHHIERPTPEFTLRVVEDGLGTPLDAELKSLYRLTDSIEFTWGYVDEGGAAVRHGGAMHIAPFMRTFGRWLGEIWPEEELPEGASDEARAAYELRWQLRGFDTPMRDGALWGALTLDEQSGAYQLYAYDRKRQRAVPLDLSLIDYLYCALGSCGSPGWQLLFAPYDFEENPWQAADPHLWMARVSELFPYLDMNFFRDRLPEPAPDA